LKNPVPAPAARVSGSGLSALPRKKAARSCTQGCVCSRQNADSQLPDSFLGKQASFFVIFTSIMKIIVILMFAVFLFTFASAGVLAQKKTIILIRHAEKDVSPGADKTDPELSAAGVARAQRLVKTIRKYKPGAVYSTNFKRTRNTAAPVAAWRKLEVGTYDPRKLDEVVNRVLTGKRKRHLIVGHNNTTPALANLFIKEEKYKTLPETEYGKIWIIKLKKGNVKSVEVMDY
jgi:phosphohistidine phosphatase SixA